MDIQQEIIDSVIYSGDWQLIRGLLAEHGLASEAKTDFTGAAFWSHNGHQYTLAYSNNVMVLNKDGKLNGVAKFDASLLPSGAESAFSLSEGSIALVEGTL